MISNIAFEAKGLVLQRCLSLGPAPNFTSFPTLFLRDNNGEKQAGLLQILGRLGRNEWLKKTLRIRGLKSANWAGQRVGLKKGKILGRQTTTGMAKQKGAVWRRAKRANFLKRTITQNQRRYFCPIIL
jgi:hypothetical protein